MPDSAIKLRNDAGGVEISTPHPRASAVGHGSNRRRFLLSRLDRQEHEDGFLCVAMWSKSNQSLGNLGAETGGHQAR